MIIAEVVKWLGAEVGSSELTTTILTIGQVVGALVAFIGRWRAGGINVFGFRK